MTKPSQDWLAQHSYPYEKFVEVWQSHIDKIMDQLTKDGMKCKYTFHRTTFKTIEVEVILHNGRRRGIDVYIVIPYDQFPNDPNCYPSHLFSVAVDTWDGIYVKKEELVDFNNPNVAQQLYELLFITIIRTGMDNHASYIRKIKFLPKLYHEYLAAGKSESYEKGHFLEMKDQIIRASEYNTFLDQFKESVRKLRK